MSEGRRTDLMSGHGVVSAVTATQNDAHLRWEQANQQWNIRHKFFLDRSVLGSNKCAPSQLGSCEILNRFSLEMLNERKTHIELTGTTNSKVVIMTCCCKHVIMFLQTYFLKLDFVSTIFLVLFASLLFPNYSPLPICAHVNQAMGGWVSAWLRMVDWPLPMYPSGFGFCCPMSGRW